jgi:hypothetical protein
MKIDCYCNYNVITNDCFITDLKYFHEFSGFIFDEDVGATVLF